MFKDIEIQEMIDLHKKKEVVLIDVRSQAEFNDTTIPGSINIPIFTNEERAEIGTIYKQKSVEAAKDRGLELFSKKLPTFIKEFQRISGEKIVFCWRGGMRSKTSATVIDLMGIKVYRLSGGYNAYRKWVVESLKDIKLPTKTYVLNGWTGTGKTAILRSLYAKGYPVLDIEGMANHRGSIFGQIGLVPYNQKMFDSLFLQEVERLQGSPFVVFEAESKRVGKVVLPEILLKQKETATQLFIDLPVDVRVKHILEDYRPHEHQEQYIEAFSRIKNRIHTPIANQIENNLHESSFDTAIQLLLEHYYDPRYLHMSKNYSQDNIVTIKAETISEASDLVEEALQTQMIKH
ncbi:tRNA 2-selenouridine(34) synthase MnmH [Litchfieldia alkalitelluris]|uniref:tRNA 2-selenouridine(34) synthase MnmH n=1 Tax=Litchfieldia alkalitelluris TaxID=304268 RepID=UPI000996A11A|nr:tRNA 2-selenouridine(34) synthase MnmH [Litchfieldia alkalitelluris]